MGIDGFSMSNLGLNRNMTSAQLANEAEATAKQALENQMADVDGIGKKEKAGRKDPDAAFNGTIPFIGEPKEQEEGEEETQQQPAELTEQNTENPEDEDEEEKTLYQFRFNEEGMIEIFNTEKNTVVKTISSDEAVNTIKGLTKIPSVFINKQV